MAAAALSTPEISARMRNGSRGGPGPLAGGAQEMRDSNSEKRMFRAWGSSLSRASVRRFQLFLAALAADLRAGVPSFTNASTSARMFVSSFW